MDLSVVVPIYNERDNVRPLCAELIHHLDRLGRSYEVILVNDGSSDGAEAVLANLASTDRRLKVVNLCRNFGQTAALMAGIKMSTGDIVIPIDGDLQNDPADIRALLSTMDTGFDVVSGWRRDRQDAALSRTWPSRVANAIISWVSGVHLHDYGCTLKAYRRWILEGVHLYGEMHRFLPIYARWHGAKITEIAVHHRPRTRGKSKYGLERIGKVLLDLLVVQFLMNYQTRPVYVFGGFGGISLGLSLASGLYAVYLKIFQGVSFILTPLPLLTVLTFMTGMMSILMGLLAELITRTYFESQGKPIYLVKNTLNVESTTTEERLRLPERRPEAA